MSKRRIYKKAPTKPTSLVEFLPDVRQPCQDSSPVHAPTQNPSYNEVYKEAYAQGYAEGFKQSVFAQQAAAREAAEAFRRELAALVDRIEAAMSIWYEKAEQGLVNLSVEIAKRVVADELTLRPEAILSIVREAISRVVNSNSAIIRVNPFDLPTLENNKEAVLQGAASIRAVEIVGDDQLARGSVVIDSQSGTVDASLDTKVLKIFDCGAAA